MLPTFFALLVAGAQLASAHFKIIYPPWRTDTMVQDENSPLSQWNHPCGGAVEGLGNRTDWPASGGALHVSLHHPWTYIYVHLGLGHNVSNFNMSLLPELVNVTGRGELCLPNLPLPEPDQDGADATIQVITSDGSGEALYNCADVTLRANLTATTYTCANGSGIDAQIVRGSSPQNPVSTSEPEPLPQPQPPPNGGSGSVVEMVSSMAQTVLLGLAAAAFTGFSL